MKKVFSFFAVAAAMLVAGTASAQLSVNAGFLNNTANRHTETAGFIKDTSVVLGSGFYVGGSYNVELIGGLGIAPGIYFDMTTKKEETKIGAETTTAKSTMMDLNIPILLNYKLTFGDDFAIFAFAGPDVVLGLSAKTKTVSKTEGISGELSSEDDWYKKENKVFDTYYTRFDFGLMFGAGVQFSSFRVEGGYELGLLNRFGEKERTGWKGSQKHNRFFVGIGYAF